jgi:hypothetical protein
MFLKLLSPYDFLSHMKLLFTSLEHTVKLCNIPWAQFPEINILRLHLFHHKESISIESYGGKAPQWLFGKDFPQNNKPFSFVPNSHIVFFRHFQHYGKDKLSLPKRRLNFVCHLFWDPPTSHST